MRRLLIRPGAIGDFLTSLPSLEQLCEGETEVWAEAQNVSLVRFARARSIQSTGLNLLGIPDVEPPEGLVEQLRSFDSVISWYGTNRPEFQEAVRRLGLAFRFFAALPHTGAAIHAADFYMEQAARVTGRLAAALPRLPCERAPADFIAIHPFSGSPRKNWPAASYERLTKILSRNRAVRWILEPGTRAPAGIECLPQTADLYELACHVARARLYVGNDSGITHLAAAAGAPVLALFGPSDPVVWSPRGRNTIRILRSPAPNGDMNAISLAEVLETIEGWPEDGPEGSAGP